MLIRKKFRFEAAHRLLSSYSQRCRGIHGHSYVVEVFIDGKVNLNDGMVVDFGLVKEEFGKFVDRFDHSLVLAASDPVAYDEKALTIMNPRFIIVPYEPTAELMAEHFYWAGQQKPHTGWSIVRVRVHETETGWAECDSLHVGVPYGATKWSRAIMEGE